MLTSSGAPPHPSPPPAPPCPSHSLNTRHKVGIKCLLSKWKKELNKTKQKNTTKFSHRFSVSRSPALSPAPYPLVSAAPSKGLPEHAVICLLLRAGDYRVGVLPHPSLTGHLAVSGDITGCHNCGGSWVEASTAHRIATRAGGQRIIQPREPEHPC